MMKPTAQDLVAYMESLRNEEQRQQLMRFFKTGKGDYGEGDEFLGLKVPQTRDFGDEYEAYCRHTGRFLPFTCKR